MASFWNGAKKYRFFFSMWEIAIPENFSQQESGIGELEVGAER